MVLTADKPVCSAAASRGVLRLHHPPGAEPWCRLGATAPVVRPPAAMAVAKTTMFADPSSTRHLRHACLADTLLHAWHTPVHCVTLEKVVDIVLPVVYSS